jgi:hypothetical protein
MTGTSHDKPMYIYDISLTSSYNGKSFRKSCRENQNIHSVFNNALFLNRVVYETTWKNI